MRNFFKKRKQVRETIKKNVKILGEIMGKKKTCLEKSYILMLLFSSIQI
jgi:hypothetical protein